MDAAVAPEPAADTGLPSWLPWPLRQPRSVLATVGTAWVLTFFPALALGWLVNHFLPAIAQPQLGDHSWPMFFMLDGFAPLVESLIMAGVLSLLLRLVPPVPAILLSSLGWGVAHSLEALGWGLVIWGPFLIFSTLYVAWRPRGFWVAVLVAAAAHAAHNLIPSLLYVLDR